MNFIKRFFMMPFLAVLSVAVVAQQVQCEIDTTPLLEQASELCKKMGQDQVCYGNDDVDAVPRNDVNAFQFERPGQTEDVVDFQSLYLGALNVETNVWGIAEMRLTVSDVYGPQSVTMILFGDVEVDNAAKDFTSFDVVVKTSYPINVRSLPSPNALLLGAADVGQTLEAIGRSEDGTWLRVRLEDLSLGWVSTGLVDPVDEGSNFDDLEVNGANEPFFGPMQAFYYTSGNTADCGNLTTDGLLIQTPQGVARLTLLINEVSIELIGSQTGTTAFVEANAEEGMAIQMFQGSANVTSQGEQTFLNTYDKTQIGMNEDMSPIGGPQPPTTGSPDDATGLPILDAIGYDPPPIPSTITIPPDDGSNDEGTSTDDSSGQTSSGGVGGSQDGTGAAGGGNTGGNDTGGGNTGGNDTGGGNTGGNDTGGGNNNGGAAGNCGNGQGQGNASCDNGGGNGGNNGNKGGGNNGNGNGNGGGNGNGNGGGNGNGNGNGGGK